MFELRVGGLDDPRVVAMLTTHVTRARAATGLGSAHALDVDGLKRDDIAFFTLWQGEALAAVGALRTLTNDLGEVKSMFTDDTMRGQGAARIMLEHIIATALAKGLHRLALETGSSDYFEPARRMYLRHGFAECPPYGHYKIDPNSTFMMRDL
ncbi:MAG: GNAT family N-acetyltransferase [Hyphomicrobiaceae bacterium]